MLELTEIPQPTRERIEEIGVADLVLGIFAPFTTEAFDTAVLRIRESIAKLYSPVRTVVVHATDQHAQPQDDIRVVSVPTLRHDFSVEPTYAISDAYHS